MATDASSDRAKTEFEQVEEKETRVSHSSRQHSSQQQHHQHQHHDEEELDAAAEKRLLWRIDRRLVPIIGLMYCVSLMDRTNLSAAAIAGMNTELQLVVGNRYSIVTLVFFVTYTVFQPPSTVIVRAVGPRLHLSFVTVAWGAVMIGMGFARSYESLLALRLVLGVFEAGFFPSCVYLLSTWYTRYEVGRRYSFFYIVGCVASAFSGILAFGLMQLGGREGLSGWRWIFIVEGVITCALGLAGYWLVVDFPDSQRKSWRFLGDRERAWVVRRVDADRGDAQTSKFELRKFLAAGLDLKIWIFAVIFGSTTAISYSLAYFLPIILNEQLHFDVGTSQCLVAPPYALAGIVMYGLGWVGDRYRVRGPIIVGNMLLCVLGLPLLGWHADPKVRYLGVFFVTAGANSNVPAAMAYQANNIRGQWKRAFCSATLVGFGGVGGIAGSLVFRSQDAPTGYRPGLWACLAFALSNIVLVSACSAYLHFENKKADRGEKRLEAAEDGGQDGFRYTI